MQVHRTLSVSEGRQQRVIDVQVVKLIQLHIDIGTDTQHAFTQLRFLVEIHRNCFNHKGPGIIPVHHLWMDTQADNAFRDRTV